MVKRYLPFMRPNPRNQTEIYRQRHPEHTVFYRVFFHYFERFLREYESRFTNEYGYSRPVIQKVVEKYLDCGNPMCGFARIRYPGCEEECLLMNICIWGRASVSLIISIKCSDFKAIISP